MDTTKALILLPALIRQRVYIGLAVVALLLTAAGAFFLASPWPVPWVIPAGLAGVGVLAGPFAVLASNNVTPDPAGAVVDGETAGPIQDDAEGRMITFTRTP